uniref:Reverse transcriptase zinc-binding domain-containing protein n=1 Tax=Lactuca sativa TaxID=4236 RepID=A0A9R1XUM6_LACSA|nr:hypothetical protein LSAT_V11C100045070 [Lactuca sativa]
MMDSDSIVGIKISGLHISVVLMSYWFFLMVMGDWLVQRISKGFHDDSKVVELFVNGVIVRSDEWLDRFPNLSLGHICKLNIQDNDKHCWVDLKSVVCSFSTKQVLRDLYGHEIDVPRYDTVWFKDNMPRNVFILWMYILGKLKTQDRVRHWEKMGNLECAFFGRGMDLHNHVFFICEYPNLIWHKIKNKVSIDECPDDCLSVV